MVLLTAYYLFATGVQSWRLRSIYQKIAKVIDTKNTVVFLRKTDESTGELCLIYLFIFQEVE